MDKEFLPYDLALEMDGIGFYETCLASFYKHVEHKFDDFRSASSITFNEGNPIKLFIGIGSSDQYSISQCKAPLWQQVFNWFDERGLEGDVYSTASGYAWCIVKSSFNPEENFSGGTSINDSGHSGPNNAGRFNIKREAEVECIKELIKIYKKELKK